MLQNKEYIYHSNKKIEKILKSFFLLHPKNVDLSLNRIKRLLFKLNNPHLKIRNVVQIAGTNGKGSIATILYQLQKSNGKKVNIYRSPHLISFNERIHICNKQISNKYLIEILEYVKEKNNNDPITFFEIITAATFYVFSINKADITILEVGLGGRLDATNVYDRNLVSIISTIGIDHQEYLGKNIQAIANEKAGIIKKKGIVISSKQKNTANNVIKKKSKEMDSKLLSFNKDWKLINKKIIYGEKKINLENLALVGEHQLINASCAILACLSTRNLNIDTEKLEKTLTQLKWPGRIQNLKGPFYKKFNNLNIWVDVAHNVLGFEVLKNWLVEKSIDDPILIMALGIKKDYKNILKQIKRIKPGLLVFLRKTKLNSHSPNTLKKASLNLNIRSLVYNDVFHALKNIQSGMTGEKKKTVIVTGSIALVGSVLFKNK